MTFRPAKGGDFSTGLDNEFIDAGDEVVIAVIDMTGRGKGSGAPLDAQAVFVYVLDAGLIVRDTASTSRNQALEAAGLR